jgi:Domain of unknown function (DUF4349)
MELSPMAFPFARIVLAVLGVAVALFLFHLFLAPPPGSHELGLVFPDRTYAFENSRKNYASVKASAPGLPIGDGQKYEKIASVTQVSANFDADRRLIEGRIAEYAGVTQLERASGLPGFRTLHLGIGVPPDRFDAFVTAIRAVGRTAQIEIIKNDKTNEYLQLRAKRTTLEKARAALEVLKEQGGSTDERMKVQNRLTEIEQQIQDLAVSLGDFDSQNELCTVKLTLRERTVPLQAGFWTRTRLSTEWTALILAGIGGGALMLVVAGWLGAGLLTLAVRLVRHARSGDIR